MAAATARRRRASRSSASSGATGSSTLVRPLLIVPVGGLAARRLLGLKSVTECVGRRYDYEGAAAIPLPHPSGASSWLNDPANRARVAAAARLVRAEVARIGRDRAEG